jgi:hypothetical protein
LATTQSIFPSALKSPIATDVGTSPAGNAVRVWSHGPKAPDIDAPPWACEDAALRLTPFADTVFDQLDLDEK